MAKKRKGTDTAVDRYLRGGSRVSRDYRAVSTEEPARALDDRVIERARTALTSDDRGRRWMRALGRPFVAPWALPTALTAVLVLSVSAAVWFSEHGSVGSLSPRLEPPSVRQDELKKASEAAQPSRPETDTQSAVQPPNAAKLPVQEFAKPEAAPMNAAREEKAHAGEQEKALRVPEPERGVEREQAVSEDARARSKTVRTPEAWLEEILELRRQGKEAEAAAELEHLKRQYPDYPLDRLEQN